MDKVPVVDLPGSATPINVELADKCPYCHNNIHPKHVYACKELDGYIQIVMKCTNSKCNKLFVGIFYKSNNSYYKFKDVLIVNKRSLELTKTIKDISPDFCKIYTEAYIAEQDNLIEICGAGYRKALEFLIKDYLIILEPEKKNEIEKTFLGNCIEAYVKDNRIKEISKRAAWLGNDEIHYVRKWEGDNLDNLKTLINLTMHWIEMEILSNKFLMDMPAGKADKTKLETVEDAKPITEETQK